MPLRCAPFRRRTGRSSPNDGTGSPQGTLEFVGLFALTEQSLGPGRFGTPSKSCPVCALSDRSSVVPAHLPRILGVSLRGLTARLADRGIIMSDTDSGERPPRRPRRPDIVARAPTGSGKTLIGLAIASGRAGPTAGRLPRPRTDP